MQGLWQLLYQILFLISQKEFTKLNVTTLIVFLEYERVKENSIKYKITSSSKDYWNKIDKELKKRFKNTFKFSNNAQNVSN